jgi:hypothetical protein
LKITMDFPPVISLIERSAPTVSITMYSVNA